MSPAAPSGASATMPLKRMLYMCELPPADTTGLAVIAKQLFSGYDQDRLHVLCCASQHGGDAKKSGHLACKHTTIADRGVRCSPRRITFPLSDMLNTLRVGEILARARDIVAAERIEVLFTIPWSLEFALAALRLHRETGLPLYVHEMDDWEGLSTNPLIRAVIRRYHGELLREAEVAWLISPAMIEDHERRFGVRGEFLSQVVDIEVFRAPAAAAPAPGTRPVIDLVYSGSCNDMFLSSLRYLCSVLNAGLMVGGKPVRLQLYSRDRPGGLAGPGVDHHGHVPRDEIPGVLARGDVMTMTVSHDARMARLVRTSLYTKSVEYAATGRPMLIVGPADLAVARYWSDVAYIVDQLDRDRLAAAIASIVADPGEVARRTARGLDIVREWHLASSLPERFLSRFRS